MPIRIFIADDHPIVRDGLRTVLEIQEDFEVVGEAATGPETLQKLLEVPADILFLDLGMPAMDGVEVIRRLQERRDPVRVIVFTVFDTDERILSAIRAGAKGYLLKGADREELYRAVRVVHRGESLLQPLIANKLLNRISDPAVRLSPRELEVLRTLARGLTNKAIAQELFISERTVKFHVSAILSKLGASNRTEAVKIAVERGILER
jgi:DNA-binding NarL/FixJ family response regulator